MRHDVIDAATMIAAGIDGRQRSALARRLRSWLSSHVLFLADPFVSNTELIRTPDYLLHQVGKWGQARGDCDDVATLTASLAAAMGLPARFVALAWGGIFLHVFCEVATPEGGWMAIDVTEPSPRTDATQTMIQEV